MEKCLGDKLLGNENSGFTVILAAGVSPGAGASKVCSTDTDSVHIGDMSRGWKDSEAPSEQTDNPHDF
ncbi:MAG: hypothetical protein CM15mP71_2320 [Candidatus Poseidoniales archaeon]|nr:MAG: hypothetical protein CM15mP71_2320 [Candidatus Poseidoniales archaeon]